MQRRWGFDDSTAHRLALMAMEQYGVMLAALHRNLRPAASRAEIGRTLRDGLVPVWLPTRMVLGRADIAESWDVTSDSLAAWLAGRLAADCLVLVKSVAAGSTVHDLVRRGIVDPALPGFLARARSECRCIAASEHAALKRALTVSKAPGTLIFDRSSRAGGSVAV